MATNQANIKAVITAEDKASSVLKNFGGEVDTTSKNASKSLDSLNTSFLAVAGATVGLVAFGKKSLDAFNEQDLAVTRLRAGIQNVTSATDKNVDGLLKQASALQKVTRFSDEQYISAQGILTTFQLNQKAIEKLTPRLADMSEGLARVDGSMPDLEGNAILVAKAIGGEDVTGLVGALRRVGVIMTDTQQKMLQTGTVEERVNLVTKILDQNFKGLGEAAGKTTSGKITELKNNFNDLQESAGKTVATGLNPLLDVLNKHPAILAGVTLALGGLAAAFVAVKVASAISTVMSAAVVAIQGVGVAAGIASTAFSGMLGVMANPVVLAIAGALADLALLYKAVTSVTQAFNDMNNAAKASESLQKSTIDAATKMADAANQGRISLDQLYRSQQALEGHQPLVSQQTINGIKTYLPTFDEGGTIPGPTGSKQLVIAHGGETVLPTHKKESGLMGNINININTGALMGNDVEARKFAQMVVKYYNDAMSSKSKAVMA